MWILLIPAALIAAGFGWGVAKVIKKDPPLPHDPATGRVDGHGTGVILGVVPPNQTVDGHGTGLIDESSSAAAVAAAIARQQQQGGGIAGQPGQSDAAAVAAAAAVAENVRQQIITALNTPEGDRTPEQLALLLGVAGLPTLG